KDTSAMNRNWMAIVAPVAALFLVTTALLSPGPALAAGTNAPWGANYFPNVVLTTQDGRMVHFWDDLLKDKKVVINFFYTECGHNCPLETAKLAQVHRLLGDRMGRDIFFYSISIDPTRDTPKVLKKYAQRFEAGPGWLFLTGRKADIELVRAKLGQAAAPGQNELTEHSATITIGDAATGQWMRDAATADPRFIAIMVRDWLSSWKDHNPGKSDRQSPPVEEGVIADRGEHLFRTRCAACHTIGHGDGLGPDLIGVAEVRDKSWLARYIAAPDEVLASGDRFAMSLFERYKKVRMPNLRLGEADVDALIRFLEARSASSHTSEKTEPQPPGTAGTAQAPPR
ncbi:MAG TPA: SCO family protein, partial [Polyangiaceae bacterium]